MVLVPAADFECYRKNLKKRGRFYFKVIKYCVPRILLKMTIIELHDEILEKAGYFLSNNKTPSNPDKLIIFVLLHYLIKSYRLFKGINLLCKNNLEQEAKILLRSLFEAYLLEQYVSDNPHNTTRAEDCVIRAHIADKKQLDQMESLGMHGETDAMTKFKDEKDGFKNMQDSVIKIRNLDYEKSIKIVRKRNPDWQNLTDSQIANKSRLEVQQIVDILNKKYENNLDSAKNLIKKYYTTVARDCSKSVHCNDLNDNVIENNEGERVCFLKSKETMKETILLTSSDIFITTMEIADKLLEFEKKELITDLDAKYKKCLQSKKNI